MAQQQEFDLGDEEVDKGLFQRSYQTEIFSHQETNDVAISKGFRDANLVPFFLADKRKLVIAGAVNAEEATMIRTVEINNQTVRLEQTAANIIARVGAHKDKRIFRHLGEREESVLQALQYIASRTPGEFGTINGSAALRFTLGQVQHCLGGTALNKAEIAEALDVLNGSTTELRVSNSQKIVKPIKSSLLPFLVSVEDEKHIDLFSDCNRATYICTFHPLITNDVCSLNYRVWNHDRIRNRRSYMAKWIEKRLSLRYVQASEDEEYSIKGSTLLLGAGMIYDRTQPPSSIFRPIERALLELTLPDGVDSSSFEARDYILKKVTREEIYTTTATRSNKVSDYLYRFMPMPHFVEQQKHANAVANRDEQRLLLARDLRLPPSQTANIRLTKAGK